MSPPITCHVTTHFQDWDAKCPFSSVWVLELWQPRFIPTPSELLLPDSGLKPQPRPLGSPATHSEIFWYFWQLLDFNGKAGLWR